jgi:hypothetical protein
MSTGEHQSASAPRSSSLLLLLISLVFALLVTPAMEESSFGGRVLIYVGVTAVLVFGVFVNRTRHWLFYPCLALAVLAVSVTWVTLLMDYHVLFVASCVLEAAFYATIACILLVAVLKKHLATLGSIFGALCVYLLLGLSWAQLYWATERMDRESLSFAGRATNEEPADDESIVRISEADDEKIARFSDVVYFSFVTMSTLGYGDIVPETPLARTLAWMQSVVGQFYLAVLVAWLVSAIPPRRFSAGGSHTKQDKENHR